MGSCKEDREVRNNYFFQKIVKGWITCLGSFMISMVGGVILTWWEVNYHPTNRQLWMVPFGLILLVTPVIVWFSVFISDICNSKDANALGLDPKQPNTTILQDNSVRDPERETDDDPTTSHIISL